MSEKTFDTEILQPMAIEGESFRIIEKELKEQGITIEDPFKKALIFRTIHTSADFDYVKTLVLSDGVIDQAFEALARRPIVVSDTNMVKAGVNKRKLALIDGEIHCFVADPDVAEEAKERGVTRSLVSMEKAYRLAQEHPDRPMIFLIGNAPTALLALNDLVLEQGFRPALIVAVPVGFVNVVEAKELILKLPVPHIVNRGRKGGSNIAAAILNALLYAIPGDDRRGEIKA